MCIKIENAASFLSLAHAYRNNLYLINNMDQARQLRYLFQLIHI